MTKQQIRELVAHLEKNPKTAMIDGETALKAMEIITAEADKLEIRWALVGGVAMSYYGSPRLTKDVDIIAGRTLSLDAERKLGFGGERYRAKVGRKSVPVDWIVRNDEARSFYERALDEAAELYGIPVVSAEWLVILKYLAGRFVDQQDAVFLLKKKGLVNRKLIRRKITETLGPGGWAAFAAGLGRWYDLADGKITTEKEDYEADRL